MAAAASDMRLAPIGRIETPFATAADCPRNGRALDPAPLCRVHVDPAFQAGLQGIEGFSHLILVYWLHLAAAPELVFTPPFDDRPRGVFATRSPRRPNPIGVSVVAFGGIEAPGILQVRYLDCVNDTPLLDIKPYLRTTDAEPEAAMGWLGERRKGKSPAA